MNAKVKHVAALAARQSFRIAVATIVTVAVVKVVETYVVNSDNS